MYEVSNRNAASRGTQIKCELHICGKGWKRGGGFVPLETHCKLPYIPSKSAHIVSATAMDTRVMGMQVKICAYLRNLARCARCSLRKKRCFKNGIYKFF